MLVVTTQPSIGFEGEKLAIPIHNVQNISCRGEQPVCITFWLDEQTVRRPVIGTFDEVVASYYTLKNA